MARRPAPCGTRGGYQRHLRLKTPPCAECKKASAEWMSKYRDEHPADYAQERRRNAAMSRAVWRLARKYPDEFKQYTQEELAR